MRLYFAWFYRMSAYFFVWIFEEKNEFDTELFELGV